LPADFLLPLFVLTLLANAILVGFAIRGMRRGQPDPDEPIGRRWPTIAPGPLSRAGPLAKPLDASVLDTPVGPVAPASRPVTPAPKRRKAAAAAAPIPAPSRPAATRGSRRRFSLPPLDDDHERVSRSIESFLSGIDPAGTTAPPQPPVGALPAATPGTTTTVALVVVDGLPEPVSIGPPTPADHPTGATGRETRREMAAEAVACADAVAMVERTLRGAARGSDVVTTGGAGRFRIVLPSTGEHAAHAYLRRVRATIEPRLEAGGRPLRLAVATATALDEPLEDVVRRAEGRLATALDAVRSPASRIDAARNGSHPSGSIGPRGEDDAADSGGGPTGTIAAGAGLD
jgi:hypothetical protein